MAKLAFLFVIFIVAASASFAQQSPFVLGGSNAVPNEFPFMVSLQWNLFGSAAHFCGGVILNNVWILTSAHCIENVPRAGFMEVFSARHNLALTAEAGAGRHSVINTFSHPNFNIFGQNQPNDLALVRLANSLTFTDGRRPIRLPPMNVVPTGAATFAGWGNIGIAASILQKATLFPIPIDDCNNAINDSTFNGRLNFTSNFCTGPMTGAYSACNGDFGGPLFQGVAPNEVLVGIASWSSTPCGSPGAPSVVFTQISAFNAWITERTGIVP